MKRVTCDIQIGAYEFKNVAEVKINSTYEKLTDTATITLPRKLEFKGKAITGDGGLFHAGDIVNISLGYDFDNQLIFSGFILDIKPGSPFEIRCENEMYLLKRGAISEAFTDKKNTGVTLNELLTRITPGYFTKTVDANLGNFRIVNATPAQVLNELNKTYALKTFFRNGVLCVGLAYWLDLQQDPPPVFTFQKDILNDHDLTFQEAESVRLKVTAISMNKDNTKTEVEIGDPEGEQRTLTYYNKTAAELKEIATRDLDRFRYDGFRGSFRTFGTPVVRHGDKIQLVDPTTPERNGFYIVKSVETTFGQNGYKQKIEIDVKV